MNKRFNTTAQGGFTLIELIVVIVILGILAATALPRFTNLGGDARIAALNAARGSLNSVVAMAHGRALVTPGTTTVNFEGENVGLTNGYPTAAPVLGVAAGLNAQDYRAVPPSSAATANLPQTTATQIAFVPVSVAETPSGLRCHVIYTQAANVTTPPTVAVVGTAEDCQ